MTGGRVPPKTFNPVLGLETDPHLNREIVKRSSYDGHFGL